MSICTCGRTLQSGALFCDACGRPVAYTGQTERLNGMSNTTNGDRVKVEDEKGNVIWLRTHLGFGRRNRAVSAARALTPDASGVPDEFALISGMLLVSILEWSGPDLDGKPITMDSIDDIPQEIGNQAAVKLNELYMQEHQPEKKATTSTPSGSKVKA